MQDAALMRVMHRTTDLHEELDDLSEWMLAFQPRRKVTAFDEPHREVMRAVLLAAFVERDDVRVVQLRDGAGKLWRASYLLARQSDSQWRIAGCVVGPGTAAGTT